MTLSLSYSQRLNLHALMGAQRSPLNDLRLLWRLQDQIALSEEEKKEIHYRTQMVSGMQQVLWDVEKEPGSKNFDFNPDEFARLARMLKEWQPGFLIGADRQWLEPLMAQFDEAENKPGTKPDGMVAGSGLGQLKTN